MSPHRKAPGPGVRAYETFRQKTVERDESMKAQARSHCYGRNAAVAEILCLLSHLRNGGAIGETLHHPSVTAEAAKWQAPGHGSQATPAAHCLPCQIYINGRDPASLARNPAVALAIRKLFGKTTVLPHVFNAADSAAERSGLKDAFVQACRHVISAPGSTDERIDRPCVRYAYETVWSPLARKAYRTAISRKKAEGAPAAAVVRGIGAEHGLIDLESLEMQRSTLTSEEIQAEEIVWVLEQYLTSLDERPDSLMDHKMAELESSLVQR